MSKSVELQITAVDHLLGRSLPLLNQISSSAWFVQQGQFEKARAVEDELNRWIAQNRGLLPDSVTGCVARLSSRITDWMMSQGSIATPHAFATDDTASFAEVERILTTYKASLVKELDSRDEALRIKVAASTPRANPWLSGSFYLVTAVVLVVLLLAAARLVAWWALPMVILGGLLGVTIVGALQLRHDGSLSEKGFLSLMLASLRQLPLLRAFLPSRSRRDKSKVG